MTIAVITDSSCQLGDAEAAAAGIDVVPITITIDGEPFLDGVELTAAEFYERIGEAI